MIAAPAKMTQGAAAPLTSVAPITTTSAPVRKNLGHQRVRRARATRAPLRRAGLPSRAAGRPSAPGTGGTGPSLSRRRDRAVISPVQQPPGLIARPQLTAMRCRGLAPSSQRGGPTAVSTWPRIRRDLSAHLLSDEDALQRYGRTVTGLCQFQMRVSSPRAPTPPAASRAAAPGDRRTQRRLSPARGCRQRRPGRSWLTFLRSGHGIAGVRPGTGQLSATRRRPLLPLVPWPVPDRPAARPCGWDGEMHSRLFTRARTKRP